MLQESYKVLNKKGLHARACSLISQTANLYKARINLRNGDRIADGKSLIKLLTLDAPFDTDIEITVEGEDEAEAMSAVLALFEKGLCVDSL